MNIGVVCHHTLGGSSKAAIMLASGLANMGYAVSLFSFFRPQLYEDGGNPNLELYCLSHNDYGNSPAADLVLNWPEELYLGFKSLVIQIIKAKHISILHAHYAVPFARLLHDIKRTLPELFLTTIVTLHGTDVSNEHVRKTYGDSLIRDLNEMDYLSTVSESHLSLCQQYYSLRAPISVIADFIDKLPPFTARPESRRPRIIHVSNFRPAKQSKLAIEVLRLVLKQKSVKLLMLGDGPELSLLKDYVKQLGLQRWVDFLGFQIHTGACYKSAELFLSTSQTESFGLAALEAMAWSLPLVVPYVGGFINLIEQHKQGRFYEPNNVEDAAKAILDILNDKNMQREMSVKAYRLARRFEADKIIGQYLAIYQAMAKA